MTRNSRLTDAGVRAMAVGLLLVTGCDSLPTHPFRHGDDTVWTDVDTDWGYDTYYDTDPYGGIEAWTFRGTYEVDTATSTLVGETTMSDVVWTNEGGLYEVGDVLCEMTWPVTQAADPVPATDCPDCTFAYVVDHGATASQDGDWCDAWYDATWDDGTRPSVFFGGFGFDPGYPYYGPVLMDLYNGSWMALAPATWDGTTLSWQRIFRYYYYY